MSKERTGLIVERGGKVYVRVTYTDRAGKRRELMRLAQDRKAAKKLLKQLVKEADKKATESVEVLDLGGSPTFKVVADLYKKDHLKPAKYVDGRKVSGLRSLKPVLVFHKRLVDHFGNFKIGDIDWFAIDRYRQERLDDQCRPAIASVNRELEQLRAILFFAKRKKLISENPFHQGRSIIHKADETERSRVMSLDEEKRLLEQCVGKRSHLKAIVIAAVDTGCRRGELLTLEWEDIDLPARRINIKAFNTKTQRSRSVPVSERLAAELEKLKSETDRPLVFSAGDSFDFKKAWASACKDAKIENLRFHDLRHTCATRLVMAGMPIEAVMKILGHTQIGTTYKRYFNLTSESLDRAREILNRDHQPPNS